MKRILKRATDRWGAARTGVAVVVSGTLIGQIILAAATPIISRIYPPDSFGAFSLILSISAVVGPAATLRLESALMLPKDEDGARILLRLGLCSSLVVSVATAFVVWLAELTGIGQSWAAVGFAPIWVGATVFATATFAVLSQAALRQRKYRAIAKRSVAQSSGMVVGQVVLGLITPGPIGLLGGFMIGRCIGYAALYRAAKQLFVRPTSRGYRTLLKEYWRFPVIFTPSSLLNALGSQLPLIMIAAWFGVSSAGELGMAQRLVFIPATLLGASFGQVFGAEMSRRIREGIGDAKRTYLKSSMQMGLIALGVASILLTMTPWLLPIILGPSWSESGFYAQAMAISVGLGLVASPMSQVYLVYQSTASIAIDASRIILILLAAAGIQIWGVSAVAAIWLLYGAQSLNYVITWVYGLRIVSSASH